MEYTENALCEHEKDRLEETEQDLNFWNYIYIYINIQFIFHFVKYNKIKVYNCPVLHCANNKKLSLFLATAVVTLLH